MKNQKGFSLIELLIVVVIIGIIAAIAIPNLIASRRAANEGSAQSVVRTIHSAQVTYQSTTGGGDFATDMTGLMDAQLVDAQVGGEEKSGYDFRTAAMPYIRGSQPATFAVEAAPSVTTAGVTQTGTRAFCSSTNGVLYQYKPAANGTATGLGQIIMAGAGLYCNDSPNREIVE